MIISSDELKIQLREHFVEVARYFKDNGVNNVGTDYDNMHNFLANKNPNITNNLLYYKLTHIIVPELIKEGVLTRHKVMGKMFFVINKEKVRIRV